MPLPDLESSRGIAGYTADSGDRYVHLHTDSVSWVASPGAPTSRPLLVSANARVTDVQHASTGVRWSLSGHVPLQFTLKNVQDCDVRLGNRKLTPLRQEGSFSHFELTEHVAPSLEALCRN